MSFPSSIPSYQGFTSTDTLAADNHAAQHNQEQADIVALSSKLGTGSSTPTNNTVLRGNGVGTTTYDTVHLATDVSGQLPAANAFPVLQAVYPVGCIYTETTGVNPNTTFGFGTWSAYAQGAALVGYKNGDANFGTAGATVGEATHTLSSSEMPSHTHTATVTDPTHGHGINGVSSAVAGSTYPVLADSTNRNPTGNGTPIQNSGTGITVANSSTGSGSAHNNIQVSVTIYVWQRTA